MDALELLVNRRSASRLAEPAPAGEQLENILRAGMRAPDHGTLQPWHFFVIEGEGRDRFSQLLEQGAVAVGQDEKGIDKARNAPFRAPMIIAVVAKCQAGHKVPVWEQEMSAGCAGPYKQLARAYIEYRHDRDVQREKRGRLNQEIRGLVEQTNSALLNENANKDSKVIPTQRDLLAAGSLNGHDATILLPAIYLMGNPVQNTGRCLGTAGVNPKYYPHIITVCVINALLSMWVMQLLF